MSEQMKDLWLKDLEVGDLVTITTGKDDEAWIYEFGVLDTTPAYWPKGAFKATGPDGKESPILPAALHGSGRWTTRQENPCQDQSIAFTPNFDGLTVGTFLVAKLEGTPDRAVMDKPGQEITSIEVARVALASLK